MDGVEQLKIGFLYNHEATHQVAHTAPILKEMLKRHPRLVIDVLTSTPEQKALVQSGLGHELCERTVFIDLDVSIAENSIIRWVNAVAPMGRVAILKQNLNLLAKYDVFVVPESTSLILKNQFGLEHLRFVLTHHGAGDRSVTEKNSIKEFDFVLVPGEKIEKRHKERGLIVDGRYAIAGYPKFDFVPHVSTNLELFGNDNPVVIYNPHFDPHLSSWYKMGMDILEKFEQTPDLNLIFAPHIMLFKRKLHTSIEYKKVKLRKKLPKRFYNAPNIHIDLGSSRSVDMTYTRYADIYIGDVSSQIYEFLETRRPTIFLNSHNADWVGNPFYMNWTTGPVLDNVSTLIEKVRQGPSTHKEYLPAQNHVFEETFELSGEKSSVKAANAIAAFLYEEMKLEQPIKTAQ